MLVGLCWFITPYVHGPYAVGNIDRPPGALEMA